MNNSLVRAESLPDWFDLEKYSSSANSSMVEWGLNFVVRKQLKGALERNLMPDMPQKKMYPHEEKNLALVKEYGFLNRRQVEDEYELARWNVIRNLRVNNGHGHGLVYDLPLNEAVEIAHWVNWDTKLRHKLAIIEYNGIFHHARTEPLRYSEQALADWYESEYECKPFDQCYESYEAHVCVDLDAPDEKIIEGFKSWLAATRVSQSQDELCQQNIPTRISDAMVKRWERNAILPYLDLQIHQLETGVEIPIHIIGDAIFPDTSDIDTTEATRKTSRPLADRVLQLAWMIFHQAIRDEETKQAGKK